MNTTNFERLNPCSNGICSLTAAKKAEAAETTRLNPCSNGICSLTRSPMSPQNGGYEVLILVLMEYAL